MSARPAWSFTPSEQRVWLSHEAVCQIDALAEVMVERINGTEGDLDNALLAMTVRIRELANAVIAALGDKQDDERRLHREVFFSSPREPKQGGQQEVDHE